MEYFILTENKKIIGVFDSLLSCLSWNPNRNLQEPIEVQHVTITAKGETTITKIELLKEMFLSNTGYNGFSR